MGMELEQYAGKNGCACPKDEQGVLCCVHFLPTRSILGVETVPPDQLPSVVMERVRVLGIMPVCGLSDPGS